MSILTKYCPEHVLFMSLEPLSDGELIREFVDASNERAFDTLLRRHYQRLHRRLSAKLRDEDKAHDLCQTLWMRVLNNLAEYKDDQKFEHYLNTIASNLLKDHWRSNRSDSEVSLFDEEGADASEYGGFDQLADPGIDEERQYINRSAINTLINKVIPALPCEQRLIYLLRHESEFWDGKQPLQWQHLAEMNDLDVEQASELFQSVRDKLVKAGNGGADKPELDCMENLVFLLWTQSHRVDKRSKLTEQYFADLLNLPVNTFKTRYRASVKALGEGMEKWR
jgi:RNA polymerase sigma-70 factor (ECF subfamily)